MTTDPHLKRIIDRFPQFKHLRDETALERIVDLALAKLRDEKDGKK